MKIIDAIVKGFSGPSDGPDSALTWTLEYNEPRGGVVVVAAKSSIWKYPDFIKIDTARMVGTAVQGIIDDDGRVVWFFIPPIQWAGCVPPGGGGGGGSGGGGGEGGSLPPLPPVPPPPPTPIPNDPIDSGGAA